MYHKFLCCWPKAPHCLQPFSTTLFVQRPQLAPGQLSSPQTKHARGHHLRFLNRGKFCGQCPHFASTYPPSPTPTWRLWPQGAWALALAGKVELRSLKFSPGQTVSKYSNYTLNIFGWKTSILELKQCRPISRSTVSRFWNVFPLLFFPMLLLLRPLQFSWLPMPSLPFSLFRWKNQQQCPPLALIFLLWPFYIVHILFSRQCPTSTSISSLTCSRSEINHSYELNWKRNHL